MQCSGGYRDGSHQREDSLSRRTGLRASDSRTVSEPWGRNDSGEGIHVWNQHLLILQLIHERITGDAAVSPTPWLKNCYFAAPSGVSLPLGYGFGKLERETIRLSTGAHLTPTISLRARKEARQAAEAAGLSDRIDHGVRDLEGIELRSDTCDAILPSRQGIMCRNWRICSANVAGH